MRARVGFVAAAMLTGPLLAGCLSSERLSQSESEAVEGTALFDVRADAPSFIDILEARFVETEEFLVAEITIDELDPSTIRSTLRDHESLHTYVGVCWHHGEPKPGSERATDCAFLEMAEFDDGDPFGASYWSARENECARWPSTFFGAIPPEFRDVIPEWGCAWAVSHEVLGGTPATVLVKVPRALLPTNEPGTQLATTWAFGWVQEIPDANDTANGPGYSLSGYACVADECVEQQVFNEDPRTSFVADVAGPAQDATILRLPASTAMPLSDGAPFIRTPRGGQAIFPGMHGYRPDLDVLQVDLEETAATLVFSVSLAELGDRPSHYLGIKLGIGSAGYVGGYSVREGIVQGASMDSHPATVEFVPGAPGEVRFSIGWDAFGSASGGGLVTFSEFYMRDVRTGAYQHRELDPPGEAIEVYGGVDGACCEWARPPYPYRLRGAP